MSKCSDHDHDLPTTNVLLQWSQLLTSLHLEVLLKGVLDTASIRAHSAVQKRSFKQSFFFDQFSFLNRDICNFPRIILFKSSHQTQCLKAHQSPQQMESLGLSGCSAKSYPSLQGTVDPSSLLCRWPSASGQWRKDLAHQHPVPPSLAGLSCLCGPCDLTRSCSDGSRERQGHR